jgi:hypothetical protein
VQKITKAAAETALEKLDLGATNRAFAGYWLSLWQGNELPKFESFRSEPVRELASNLIVFDTVPGNRVTVRSAGRDISTTVRAELDGVDWVMFGPVRGRRLRMRNFEAIADGAIMLVRRRLTMVSGSPIFNQELILPFAPSLDGTHLSAAHVDWRIDDARRLNGIAEIEPLARNHKILSIQSRTRRGIDHTCGY